MHKRSGDRAALRGKRVALAVTAAFLPWGETYALPTGEHGIVGDVTVTRPTTQTMQINQGTQKGIVNWQGFSIGGSEHVNITQPNASAALLNRVVGNSPTEIFGRLTANGQVFLVNNAGVLFAPGASVSAAGIIASTLSITDQNFLNPVNGKYEFYNPGNAGSVVNQAGMSGATGSIVTAGGFTALIGPQVRNDGIIIANSGKVALGAGDRVTLDIVGDGLLSISVDQAAANAALVNTGTLQADGGTVLLKASGTNALLDAVLNTSGVLRANALVERNGEIVLDAAGPRGVQIAGTVEAGGSVNVRADGALNVGATACCSPTQVTAGSQTIEAGAITVGGGATVRATTGSQTVTTPGTLLVRGGVLSGDVGFFHDGSDQQRVTAGSLEVRGGTGTNTGAFINSRAGGDQTVTVTGNLTITGGASGTGNRAGIVSTGNQTIDAASIELRSGAGTDASATLNAARQVIATTGNVSLFGGAGPGGSNGVRIGGIGGTTLGPTDLTLNAGGNLLLHGGTVNGASLGSSGASTQANTIAVTAGGDITLESLGAGARIGSSNQVPVPAGTISVTAGSGVPESPARKLQLGTGTAIRANGPITLTADSLINDGTITNGGGSANMLLSANSYDLAGSNIQGGSAAVLLRPRDGTRSFGIEAANPALANHTNLTNADIASINTSNFIVFGSGMGTNFTGNMTIGQNATVNGGTKSLAFFRSSDPAAPSGSIMIGANGVTSAADIIVGAGRGSIVNDPGGGGTIAGDEVQLRASQGIGAPFGQQIHTAANALAVNNTGAGGALVTEADGVTLRTISLSVGGIQNTFGNSIAGVFDLTTGGAVDVAGVVTSGPMFITAGGALNVMGAGAQDGILSSTGGQTITAQSVNVTARDGRLGQIVNHVSGAQTITTGALSVNGGSALAYPTLSGIVQNAGHVQTVNASSVQVQGTDTGANNGIFIRAAAGDQALNVAGDITIAAGAGGEAWIQGSAAGQQIIHARNITMTNAQGGTNSFAALQAGHQEIHASGDVRLTGGATAGTQGGVRMGGLRNPLVQTATDLRLFVDGDLVLTGGTAPDNGASIGTSGSFALPNNIYIEAGSVVLNAGTASGAGVRIGSGSNALADGSIEIHADRNIALNGTAQSAAIRTLGDVTLDATSVSAGGNGFILADSLTVNAPDGITLGGANRISRLHATTFTGDMVFNNTGALEVLQVDVDDVNFTNAGAVTVTGLWNSSATTITTTGVGADLTVNNSIISAVGPMNVNVAGALAVNASSAQAGLQAFGPVAGQMITAHSVSQTAQNGFRANIENFGPGNQSVTASAGDINLQVPGAFGVAQIINNAPGGNQTVTASGQLNVLGGVISPTPTGSRNSGIFKNGGAGMQTVRAAGITLQGASSLNTAGALIVSQGDQYVDVTGGTINLFGGNGGIVNNAVLAASPLGQQTVLAHDINMSNGVGGTDTVAGIFGGHQLIDVTGNVTLTSQGALLGTAPGGPGVRIGAPGGSTIGTDLRLLVDGNLVLQGGTVEENGAAIGSSGFVNAMNPPRPNTIHIEAGSVTLNAGTESDTGVRIGSGSSGTAGGNITIEAVGSIQLNGTERSAAIRTLDDVTLEAASISEAGNGFVLANSLTTRSTGGDTSLTGPNQVSSYNGTSSGDLSLTNTGALTVTGLSAFNAALTNQGDVAVSGPWNSFGAAITTTGAGSDLTVRNSLTSSGAMNVNVAGDITVTAGGGQDAMLRSFGGQTIRGRSLAVTSNDGRFAAVWNTGPNAQTINVSGGAGVDVQTLSSGGFAQISADAGGSQTISVDNGDHIKVNGANGGAAISNFGGTQTLSISGSGANAIILGTAGALGPSQIIGGVQHIAAGSGGESGSISIVGGDANATFTGISSGQIVGGTQKVSTSGTLRISGGNAPSQPPFGFATGLFHNGSGEQTLSAADLEMQGGSTGANNTAIIISSGGAGTIAAGNQLIDVGAGNIELAGGAGGGNNTAIIVSFANQTVTAGGVELRGGTGGAGNGAFINSGAPSGGTQLFNVAGAITVEGGAGTSNSAGIFQTSSGAQTVNAARIELRGGASGANSGAFINVTGGGDPANAGVQVVSASGDIDIAGGAGGNAGIQGSASQQQTIHAHNISLTNSAGGGNNSVGFILGGHQEINAGGNVALAARASGGDLPGVRIGGLSGNATLGIPPTATDLTLNVGGDLILTAGTAANNGVGIGSTAALGAPVVANDITINAGGSVILNAGTLTGTGARIGSPGTGTGPGNISITAGGGIELHGATQVAAIRTLDTVALDAHHITETGNGFIVAATLNTTTHGDATLTGPNQVGAFTASSTTGNVSLTNTAPVLTLGSMDLPGSLTIDQTGTLSIPGTVSALSHTIDATGDVLVGSAGATDAALLYASDSISITTTGDVIVRGSDVTPLAASAILADGALNVSAGNVSLIAGAALATPAVARGDAVHMTIGDQLHVTGGSGHLSPALLSSGSNIDLTVGGAVRIDAGSGHFSVARIQTEIRDGVIHISFPNLAEGGYFVNGIEGRTHHGQTGFFTANKPAKVGRTLVLEYGAD